MKTEGSREHLAYLEAKNQYLAIGKRYSDLLLQIMKCDPNILKIAEDILITGDRLASHDNRFLTVFYNELKAKSKIEKKYYDLLLELKKTKNELDHATHKLSRLRIAFIMRRAGIPPKRTNQGIDAVTSQLNSTEIGLLEKISLPDVLQIDETERLELLLVSGEIEFTGGEIVGKTKAGREFVKTLSKDIVERANNRYFLGETDFDIKKYVRLDRHNLLDFIRATADQDHVREIERRIASKDLRLQPDGLFALTPRGEKYLTLLLEELSAQLEGNFRARTVALSKGYSDTDSRLGAINEGLRDLDISLDKHTHVGALAGNTGTYQSLLKTAKARRDQVSAALADAMTTQEVISASFVDVKRQLAVILDSKNVDVTKLLSLIAAVRYISVFENQYESKLARVEGMLGLPIKNHGGSLGPDSLAKISDNFDTDSSQIFADSKVTIMALISGKLAGRHDLGIETNKTLMDFMLDSSQVKNYGRLLGQQDAVRKHVVDTLYSRHSLYEDLDNISEVLSEYTELEIEKKEHIADLVHELELAHKELWLANIKNNNGRYIDTSFAELPSQARDKAKGANNVAIASARKEIRETLGKYRASHKKHSDDFGKVLRQSLSEISKGGDVGKISASLKGKYKQLNVEHDTLMQNMEKNIATLEKRLLDFERKTPAEIEKLLLSDIRANI